MEIVLNSYGSAINCENNAFVVTSSNGQQRIPIEGVTSVHLTRGTNITSDAVLLALANEVEIIFSDKMGNPMGRIWSPKYGSISTIRKGQLAFAQSNDAVIWIKNVIEKKIGNQMALIQMMNTDDIEDKRLIDTAIKRLDGYRKKTESIDGYMVGDIAHTLRGLEGLSSKIYFETLNLFIPKHLRFAERSQHPALDPVNAMLNYGYGLLYSKVECALIKAGIDPYIGILHRDNYNRPVLVYDVIELFRIWVDYIVFSMACQNVVTEDFYSVKPDGSCWLEPFGRRVLIQSVNDYLEEVIDMKGVKRSRVTHIMLYAQTLAQQFKKFNTND